MHQTKKYEQSVFYACILNDFLEDLDMLRASIYTLEEGFLVAGIRNALEMKKRTCKTRKKKNFNTLRKYMKLVPVFPVSRSLVQNLRRFSNSLCSYCGLSHSSQFRHSHIFHPLLDQESQRILFSLNF